MARIRSVHPSLFTDESWVSCSPLTRILYIGLWTDADDQGVFEWKPLQIKMRLLPGDTGDVAAMLAEMESVGLVKAYEVEGKRYGAIANFRKFQRPQKPNAIHPLPEIIAEYVCLSPTDPKPVADQYDTDPVNPPQMEDGGGKVEEEANASPSPPKRAVADARRGSRIPDDWEPSRSCNDFALAEGLTPQETARAAAEFRDYWRSRSGRDAAKLDWPATWRNRVRQIADRKRPAGSAGGAKPGGYGSKPVSMAGILAERRRQAEGSSDVPGDGRILLTG